MQPVEYILICDVIKKCAHGSKCNMRLRLIPMWMFVKAFLVCWHASNISNVKMSYT